MKTIQRTFLAFLFVALPSFGGDGVAFITNLKGEVAVDGNARPLLLSELAKGQKITLAKDSQVSVMYTSSGKEFVLKGPGDYVVTESEVSGAAGAAPVARDTEWRASSKVLVQVALTSSASVRMRSIAKPKVDESPKLLFPTEGVVTTLQPTFRWRASDPKALSQFALMVVGHEKPVHLAKLTSATYRVPAKLKPETEYAWTVSVAGDEIGSGKFRTLSAPAQQQVDKRRPSDKSEFSDRLLFTLMLQDMGAAQEAQESWARLAQERNDLPELSALAH